MQITLWQLNESYQALVRLAQTEFPKDRHKLTYKLSRVMKSAKTEIDALGESLNDLMRKCGLEPGAGDMAPDKLKDYNDRAKVFMRETYCDLWGEPIKLDDLADVSITAFDLALLDWLIIEE
jgi:hypothetical protein